MNKKTMTLALVAGMGMMSSCSQQLKSGIDLKNLDTEVKVGEDFYQYATGGWQKANPLTAEYSRFGSFDVLQENNNKDLRDIIEEVAGKENKAGSIEQKIASLYNSAMDSVKLNERGMQDLAAFLACDGYQSEEGLANQWLESVWPRMQRQGVSGMFGFYITADEKDAKNNALYIVQGGLTLGQKDYYVDQDEDTKKIREAYKKYIADLSKHVGFSEEDAQRISEDVMRIETILAENSKSMTELRDPEANYNKLTYAELKEQFAGINWDAYFQNFGISGLKEVIFGQPNAIHAAEQLLNTEPAEAIQNYYLWHAINMAADYIDDDSRAIAFAFWGKVMSGKQEDRPRWKRAVESVEDGLGEALGQLYVAKHFPPAAKERMVQLVKNLQVALGQRIDEQDWMSDETKKVAHGKLDAFYVKVGYPDTWTDYSALEIGDSYLNNILACNEWSIKDN
ncbi:MAG: M13 family metallopeptidase N-terminal domain-containing protein, partial [Bacteroidaceae bacterium]|nr:M13 family metallopeptidase N-terminal domain-containing protein [Bacteroidaceae bacterium]